MGEKYMSTQEVYNKVNEAVALNEMSGIEVLDLFVQYMGQQIMTVGFLEHVKEEGYIVNDR